MKERANSSDFIYSEANEASRISVSILGSPKKMEKFLLEKKKEESTIWRIAKEKLQKGRRRIIYSKLQLTSKQDRYERKKDQFAKIFLKQNRLRKGGLLREKTSNCRKIHRRAFSKPIVIPSPPNVEEFENSGLYSCDDFLPGKLSFL